MISKRDSSPELGDPIGANANDASQVEFLGRIGLPQKWFRPKRWQRRLRRQRQWSRFIRELGAGKSPPLLWGVPRELLHSNVVSAIQAGFESAKQIDNEPGGVGPRPIQLDVELDAKCSVSRALYLVHLAQVSPLILARAEPADVWRKLEQLCQLVSDVEAESPQSPWYDQLTQIELPLTLAHQLPDLVSLKPLIPDARRKLEQSLAHWLDFEGMLEMKWWPEHRAILAGWLRCARLLQLLGFEEPSAVTRQRLFDLFRHMQRATYSANGAMLIEHDVSCGFGRLMRLAETVLGGNYGLRGLAKSERETALGSSSEPAGLTLMQTAWKRSAAKVAVQHVDHTTSIHVWRAESLFWGHCFPLVAIGQQWLKPHGRWEVSCWHCDADIQVLDLELEFEQDVRLDRTIVLANEDGFLFMADAFISREPQSWTYSLDLPLAAGISAEIESETREAYLRNASQIISTAMPLAAPEWKTAPAASGLDVTSRGLTLRHSHQGGHLFAPLFIDLKPRRSVRPHTWRALTVAHNRAMQSADTAIGYRVRSGNNQWLFYRSFGDPEPHSVLSKHLACEFYVGRIEKDHSITDLIQFK